MPFDDRVHRPLFANVEPSSACELSWLVVCCRVDNKVHALPASLAADVAGFWGESDDCLFPELLVVAHQVGCLRGLDISPLFDLDPGRLAPDADLDLATEPIDDREKVRRRLGRLAAEPDLATRYSALLRAIWEDAAPAWNEFGLPAVRRAVARAQAAIDHGQAPFELVPDGHIARREPYRQIAERALNDGTLLLSPCYFAGQRGHIIALDGLISIAIGTGVTPDVARERVAAERVARDMKVLGDATRVLILTELIRSPAPIGEIARRVGVAQPTASVHFRLLREAGLVTAVRDGGTSTYRVAEERLRESFRQAEEALLPKDWGWSRKP